MRKASAPTRTPSPTADKQQSLDRRVETATRRSLEEAVSSLTRAASERFPAHAA